MATINVTSGPQIQDFKVRNAIDTLTAYVSNVGELVSINAGVASTPSNTTIASLNAGGTSIIAQAVVDIIAALRTAKLMR